MPIYDDGILKLILKNENSILIKIIRNPIIKFFQNVIEVVLMVLLNLPIPVYSTIINIIITNLPGFPHISGCYLRALYYKPKMRKMGKNVIIDQGVNIFYPKNMELSDYVYIDKYVTIASKETKIGRRVHIAPYTFITGGGNCIIEDFAGIANNCSIITSTVTSKEGIRLSGPMIPESQTDIIRGEVIIKKDAFIGTKATIFTNVTVSEGSVIGAGTIITKTTEPWGVYISEGGKAKLLRKRKIISLEDV